MRLQDFSDPELRRLKGKTVLIPVGSLEQHGQHLPVSTDSDIVSEVARRVAKKCGLLLLPTVSYGVSFEHAPFFNLSVRPAILQNFLYEVCVSLAKNKISKIMILNGHHGNQKALKALKTKIDKKYRGKIKVFVFSYWHFMENEFDHAGFVETSLMLAISDKANMKLAKKGLVTDGMTKKQKAQISRLASLHFIKATKTGVWGDPTRATRRDGRRILAEIVKNITKTVSKLA
ncbi:MAG TPA: creatininase family protein [Candidatus Binatia bacterium]|nr:creatininase family protein [Candidatus Binatia bacterium]